MQIFCIYMQIRTRDIKTNISREYNFININVQKKCYARVFKRGNKMRWYSKWKWMYIWDECAHSLYFFGMKRMWPLEERIFLVLSEQYNQASSGSLGHYIRLSKFKRSLLLILITRATTVRRSFAYQKQRGAREEGKAIKVWPMFAMRRIVLRFRRAIYERSGIKPCISLRTSYFHANL